MPLTIKSSMRQVPKTGCSRIGVVSQYNAGATNSHELPGLLLVAWGTGREWGGKRNLGTSLGQPSTANHSALSGKIGPPQQHENDLVHRSGHDPKASLV